MGWIRRETEKGTTQYICPNCHDYHEFREDFGEQTFSENFIFCRRCGARNGTGTVPTLTPPNEWVNRVRELDELYTKLQIVTGFTAEQLLEIFAAGYTLEKPDYSKKFAEMENLAEAAQPNEPLTLEELREMDGVNALWVHNLAWGLHKPRFMLVHSVSEDWWTCCDFDGFETFCADDYGGRYLLYRRPPEVSP